VLNANFLVHQILKGAALKIAFVFVCTLLLGVPVWWKTTEVYRTNLPFQDIERTINNSVSTKVVCVLFVMSFLSLWTFKCKKLFTIMDCSVEVFECNSMRNIYAYVFLSLLLSCIRENMIFKFQICLHC